MNTITDRTKFNFTVVVGFLGFCSWLTVIWYQGQSNAQAQIVSAKAIEGVLV